MKMHDESDGLSSDVPPEAPIKIQVTGFLI